MKESITNIEREFLLQSLKDGRRADGRKPHDMRKARITFGSQYGLAEVQLGRTRVIGVVTYDIVEPFRERPSEGFLQFNTELSPMASTQFEPGRPTEDSIEISRIIERALKTSRAIDTEALCIATGEKVWSIRVDLHVVDDGGNVKDCAGIAAIAALLHFRRPEVSVVAGTVQIHSMEEREPVALSVHHIPICFSFAFFEQGDLMCVDPLHKEEMVATGSMTVAVNVHSEVCGIYKGGGVPVTKDMILQCTALAAEKAREVTKLIQDSLQADNQARAAARVAHLKLSEDQLQRVQQQAARQSEFQPSALQRTADQLSHFAVKQAEIQKAKSSAVQSGAAPSSTIVKEEEVSESEDEDEEDADAQAVLNSMIMDQDGAVKSEGHDDEADKILIKGRSIKK